MEGEGGADGVVAVDIGGWHADREGRGKASIEDCAGWMVGKHGRPGKWRREAS